MTDIVIAGGRALIGGTFIETPIALHGDTIASVGATVGRGAVTLDARDLRVLPGIVDLHGDAFERQMMPRPGVDFAVDIALIDSDRQVIANGITTVFHGVTWSWEPGLRGAGNAQQMISTIASLQPRLAADTRLHLRQETFNLDAEAEICAWIAAGRVGLLAFNDHIEATIASADKPQKRARMVERTGLSDAAFDRLAGEVASRAGEVPASIARLAAAAGSAGVPMLSHDDGSPQMRGMYRALGVGIAEFPINEATARDAADAGDAIVFGAPNVVRGGSHIGWTRTSDMIAKGLCSVLASDYYYPAPLLAAFRLVADGVRALPEAWSLVSRAPAVAAGLSDRGELAPGRRADILLVDDAIALRPRVVAVISGGRLVHLTEADRISRADALSGAVAAA